MDSSPAQNVTVNFSLALGEARIDVSAEAPSGDVTVTQMLPVLQTLTDRFIEGAVAKLGEMGEQVSCRAGCGACCRQLIPLSLIEAEALAQWIRTLPEEQQIALQGRFHAALGTLSEHGILEKMSPELWEEGIPASRQVVIDYLGARVACPFLENESCSIHPIRPLVCREYLVTSPPEFCSMPSADKVKGVNIPLKLSKALYGLSAKLEGEAVGWIPLVFLFHWMRSGAQPGKRMSGPGPQVLYAIISELKS